MAQKKAKKKIHKHGKLRWHAISIKHSKRKKVKFPYQWWKL